ncbi:hypothetical protein [Dactylosporangium sp. CS-033363]|uniref:hypothetical protein n=1 Tax=Dactylosporangium sp. CS-033363 TaxID=3239935 RepID=UPI003D8A0354
MPREPHRAEPLTLRLWWLFPLLGLVLLSYSPGLALLTVAILFGLGFIWRVLAKHEYEYDADSIAIPEQALGEWAEIERLTEEIRAAWPTLGAPADPRDIGPELARARYRLAELLDRRAELDRAAAELRGVARDLPGDDASGTLYAEVDARRAEVAGELGRRVAALRRLGAAAGEHAERVRRAEQAREAVRRAELVAARPDAVEPDGLGEVAGRTGAALDAYWELSAPPSGGSSGSRSPSASPSPASGEAGGGTV